MQCRYCVRVWAAGDWDSGLWELHVYYWDEMTDSLYHEMKSGFALADKFDDIVDNMAQLAAMGLVHGGLENAWDCCVV